MVIFDGMTEKDEKEIIDIMVELYDEIGILPEDIPSTLRKRIKDIIRNRTIKGNK